MHDRSIRIIVRYNVNSIRESYGLVAICIDFQSVLLFPPIFFYRQYRPITSYLIT